MSALFTISDFGTSQFRSKLVGMIIVWWMNLIYELFFANPCKHPNFWGESGRLPQYGIQWKIRLVSSINLTRKCEIFLPSNPVILIDFSGIIQLGDQFVSLIYALPHINPEYGDVCTPSQSWVVLVGFLKSSTRLLGPKIEVTGIMKC